MKYGYARVSMDSQCLDLQIEALQSRKCDKILSEKISSRNKRRPKLDSLLNSIESGDEVICYKLDRLGRSLKELVEIISFFEERNIRFISIADQIDTSLTSSKLLTNILMCICEWEREMISIRTIAGLQAARKRGVILGRPKGSQNLSPDDIRAIQNLRNSGKTPTQIQRITGISRPSIYKYTNSSNPII